MPFEERIVNARIIPLGFEAPDGAFQDLEATITLHSNFGQDGQFPHQGYTWGYTILGAGRPEWKKMTETIENSGSGTSVPHTFDTVFVSRYSCVTLLRLKLD